MVLAACFRLFSFAQWVKPALCCALMLFWISMSRLIFPFRCFGWREGLARPAIRAARASFGVVHTQGFQTGEPFLIRRSGRDIFAPLDLIGLLSAGGEAVLLNRNRLGRSRSIAAFQLLPYSWCRSVQPDVQYSSCPCPVLG